MASGCTALVPFTLASPFGAALQAAERLIPLGGRTYSIAQRYKPDGRGGTQLGFGASVYNCSILLAAYLLDNAAPLVHGNTVLELGAGLGLVSIVAAASTEASIVVCTDGDADVVSLAAENALRNGVGGKEAGAALEGSVGSSADRGVSETLPHRATAGDAPTLSCRQLLWGSEEHMASALREIRMLRRGKLRSKSEVIDRGGRLLCSGCGRSEPFVVDLVVGADIVAVPYAAALEALVDTLRRLMTCCHFCGHPVAVVLRGSEAGSAGSATMLPAAGTATMLPAGGSAAMLLAGGSAAMLPAGGSAAMLPAGGSAAMLPAGGSAPMLPAGGSAAVLPAGGSAAMLPAGGSAAVSSCSTPSDRDSAGNVLGGPFLPAGSPSPFPTFLLAFQRRHHEEDAFFAGMCAFSRRQEVAAEALHPDFRVCFPPLQLFAFTARVDAAPIATAPAPPRGLPVAPATSEAMSPT
jgi:SAM-dependent methyltransferase